MKKANCIALLLGIILITVKYQSALAQERNATDYIINASGDTVRCQIKKTLFGNTVKYKTDKMSDYEEVSPYQVKQYFHHKDDFPYRLVTLDNDKKVLYLGLLEEGEINLYERLTKSTTQNGAFVSSYNTVDWYVEKGLESPIYVKSNRVINTKGRSERKADFVSLISDKPTVLDEFNKDNDYSFDSIRDIVHVYNTGRRLKKD